MLGNYLPTPRNRLPIFGRNALNYGPWSINCRKQQSCSSRLAALEARGCQSPGGAGAFADRERSSAGRECRVAASPGTEQPEQPQAAQQRWVSEEADTTGPAQREEAVGRTGWAQKARPCVRERSRTACGFTCRSVVRFVGGRSRWTNPMKW
jgi:hypothetical protein